VEPWADRWREVHLLDERVVGISTKGFPQNGKREQKGFVGSGGERDYRLKKGVEGRRSLLGKETFAGEE